ncbi:uncharacterized protein [Ambystoma mexicanum]|uniref:uncharacterized protein isoform X2 n=1 Tax=Ambystoma mexicanum TaxID=8296 RepID=UPI0037E898A3
MHRIKGTKTGCISYWLRERAVFSEVEPWVMLRGLGALEVFLDTEEGAAFVTDNDMYMSCNADFKCSVLHTVEQKDPSCKFQVSIVPSGKVLLQDYRGLYLSSILPNGVRFLEPDCPAADVLCEFEPYYEDDKVALRAANGMFLCRVFQRYHYIEPSRPNPDECCRFRLVLGDLLCPSFEITAVKLENLSKVKCQPCVLKKETFINRMDVPQDHVFNLTWDVRTIETTTWSRAWGMDSKCTFNFTLLGIEGTVSYNGTYHKTAIFRHTVREERSATVNVLPNSRATAYLVVAKQESAEIPFTATIKKVRSDGNSVVTHENGKWKGLVYDTVTLEIKQEDLRDETPCKIL